MIGPMRPLPSMRLSALALLPVFASLALAAPSVIKPGDPGAPIASEHAEIVSGKHPALWVASVCASAYSRGHEPHLVIDGDPATDWRVSGPPPAPMVRGNWVEVQLNQLASIDSIEVHWLGDARYAYKIYKQPRDDFREQIVEGVSAGGDAGLEKIQLPPGTLTQTIRVEFATAQDKAVQGIRELRVGGLAYPAAYPRAADKYAPVETVRRIVYVEFERLPYVNTFEPKLPYADGGAGLRLLPRDDAFEGGHADFAIATTPGKDNWVTLKLWESHAVSMTQRGDLIAIETLDGSATQRGRSFYPVLVTDQQHNEQEWDGGQKPQPGRWSYAHYKLPAELVGKRRELKLRLQGVGNLRRDYPMRSPSPVIYTISCATAPLVE